MTIWERVAYHCFTAKSNPKKGPFLSPIVFWKSFVAENLFSLVPNFSGHTLNNIQRCQKHFWHFEQHPGKYPAILTLDILAFLRNRASHIMNRPLETHK
jgi:hypothetical protein